MAGQANVYVVESDNAQQQEIKSLLVEQGYTVQAYATAEDFLDNIDPNVAGCVLADANIPSISGIGLLNRLRDIDSVLRLVITSNSANVPMVVDAFDNGVTSFVEKPFNQLNLFEKIDHAIELSRSALELESERSELFARSQSLTAREVEIMCMIASGMITKQIARELKISDRTVETHRANMMKKVEVSHLADLVKFAIKAKLCEER